VETLKILGIMVVAFCFIGFIVKSLRYTLDKKSGVIYNPDLQSDEMKYQKQYIKEQLLKEKEKKEMIHKVRMVQEGVSVYGAINKKFFGSYGHSNVHLVNYAKCKEIDVAHEYALKVQEYNALPSLQRMTTSVYSLTRMYEDAIERKAQNYNRVFLSYDSYFMDTKQQRIFKVISNYYGFFSATRKEAKEFVQKHFDQKDGETALFYYENQELFARYASYFSETNDIEHLLNSLPDEARIPFITLILSDNQELADSVKSISSSLSQNIVDNFVAASKLARANEKN